MKILATETKYEGSVFTVAQQRLQFPNGNEARWDVVQHVGAAAVVAVTPRDEMVLVRQYRTGTQKEMLELPAGRLDPDEAPAACAARELEEETGYRAGRWRYLTGLHVTPAYCTEVIHLFAAEDAVSTGQTNPDENEFVETVLYPVADVLKMIYAGEITDAKTITGVLLYVNTRSCASAG